MFRKHNALCKKREHLSDEIITVSVEDVQLVEKLRKNSKYCDNE